jgi:hypothetical protein
MINAEGQAFYYVKGSKDYIYRGQRWKGSSFAENSEPRGSVNIQNAIWKIWNLDITHTMHKSYLCKEVCEKASVPTDVPLGSSWVAPECCQGSQAEGQDGGKRSHSPWPSQGSQPTRGSVQDGPSGNSRAFEKSPIPDRLGQRQC